MNITNDVSITIDEVAMQKIADGFKMITSNMPKLITLTPEQRQTLPKMGDKTIAFVNKAYEYAKQNPKIVPSYLNMEEFYKDVTAMNTFFQIVAPIQKLTEEIDDTMMLAGSEAYAAALAFYTALKAALAAGETGLKGVYEDMSVRFPGRGAKKTEQTTDNSGK